MNVAEAKKTLDLFSFFQDEKRTLKEQMPELAQKLVPSCNEESLYERSSLRGRAITWLYGKESRRKQTQKVLTVVNKALTVLAKQGKQPEKLSPERCIELKKLIRDTLPAKQVEKEWSDELDALREKRKEQEEKVVDEEELARQNSLLNENRDAPVKETLDDDAFSALFDSCPTNESYYSHVEKYLESDPPSDCTAVIPYEETPYNRHVGLPKAELRVSERLALFREAQAFSIKAEKDMEMGRVPKDDATRQALRKDYAKQLADQASNLKTGERMMFRGSYGTKIKNLKVLLEVFEHLPADLIKDMPPSAQEFIKNPDYRDPEKFVKEQIHHYLKKHADQLPADEAGLLNTLFSDDTRDLPPQLKSVLPQLFADPIQRVMAQGILGNFAGLSSFTPSHEVMEAIHFALQIASDQTIESPGLVMFMLSLTNLLPGENSGPLLKFVADHGKEFANPDTRDQALEKLEVFLMDKVQGPMDSILQPLINGVQSLFKGIIKFTPTFLVRLSDYEHLFCTGQYWLEVKREKKGDFTVFIYGDNYASQNHRHILDNTEWPLTLKHVKEENLNTEFFSCLLHHHLETGYDSDIKSTAAILYEEVFPTLKGTIDSSAKRIKSNKIPDDDASILNTLIFPENNSKTPYQMKLQAFLLYCRQHMKEGRLAIKDNPEACRNLAKAMASLQKEVQSLEQPPTQEEKEKLEATFKEVTLAMRDQKQESFNVGSAFSLSDPIEDAELFSKTIAQALRSMGLSPEAIRDYREPLEWALGDDMMTLLDRVADSMDKLPPVEYRFVKPQLPAFTFPRGFSLNISPHVQGKGWLREIVTHVYFQTIFRSLQLAYGLYRFTSPAVILFMFMPSITSLLPAQLQIWYHKAKRIAIKAAAEAMTYCLLRLLMDTKCLEKLKELKQKTNTKVRDLLEPHQLSFSVENVDDKTPFHPIFVHPDNSLFPVEGDPTSQDGKCLNIINRTKTITADNLQDALYEWLAMTSDTHNHAYNSKFLLNHLGTLPLPSDSSNCPWHSVKNIDPMVRLLSDLTGRLAANQLLPLYSHDKAKTILYSYRLLAIMEFLAKRNPQTKLEKYYVDTDILNKWAESEACVLYETSDVEHLDALISYFANTRPNPDDRVELEDNEQDHSESQDFTTSKGHPPCNRDFFALFPYRYHDAQTNHFSRINHSQERYLRQFMDDIPRLHRELKKVMRLPCNTIIDEKGTKWLSQPVDKGSDCPEPCEKHVHFSSKMADHVWEHGKLIGEEPYLRALIYLTNDYSDSNTIIPLPFLMLKHQAFICNELIMGTNKDLPHSQASSLIDPTTFPELNRNTLKPIKWNATQQMSIGERVADIFIEALFRANSRLTGACQFEADINIPLTSLDHATKARKFKITLAGGMALQDLRSLNQKVKAIRRDNPVVSNKDLYLNLAIHHAESNRPTQSNIMKTEHPELLLNATDNRKDKLQSQMIFTHLDDQIPRVIAYFRTRMHLLENSSNHVFLREILFNVSHLSALLMTSPETVKSLSAFIIEALESKENKHKHRTVRTAIGLIDYCQRFAPEMLPHFPDIKEYIRNSKDKKIVQNRYVLLAIAYGALHEGMDKREFEEAIEAFCLGRLTSQLSANSELKNFYNTLFFRCRNLIRKTLKKRRDLTNRIGKKICRVLDIQVKANPDANWRYGGQLILKHKNYHLNLSNGSLYGAFVTNREKIAQQRIPHLRFETPEEYSQRGITIEYQQKDNRTLAVCRRTIKDVRYIAYPDRGLCDWLKIRKVDVSNKLVWVEDKSDGEKRILLESKDNGMVEEIGTMHSIDSDGKRMHLHLHSERDVLIDVNAENCPGLKALEHFAPATNIHAKRQRGEKSICSFNITPYDLSFDVREVNDKKRAYNSNLFPDYFIAENQNIHHVRSFGAYLLLKNEQGKRKIMIPDGQWIASGAWNALSHASPFAHLAGPLLRQNCLASTTKAYTYDMDANGRLTSEDPEALLYLLSLYLLQRNNKAALDICEQIESISKRAAIDPACLEKLLPLTMVPELMEEAVVIRLRLMAAFEQNHSTPFAGECLNPTDHVPSSLHELMFVQAIIRDLYNLQSMTPYRKKLYSGGGLTDEKEWFLYKGLFRHAANILKKRSEIPEFIRKRAEQIGWENLLETLVLPPALALRYAALKEKYDVSDPIAMQALRFVTSYYKTPSSIPGYYLDPIYWLGKAQKALNQVSGLDKKMDEGTGQLRAALDEFFSIQNEVIELGSLANTFSKKRKIYPLLLRKKIIKLRKESGTPPLMASSLTDTHLAQYLYEYYTIAKGDGKPGEKEKLQKMLYLYQGKRTHEAVQLIQILQSVCNYSGVFPSPESFIKAIEKPASLPDLYDFHGQFKIETPYVENLTQKHLAKERLQIESRDFCTLYDMAQTGDPDFTFFVPELMKQLKKGTVDGSLTTIESRLADFLFKVRENPTQYYDPKTFRLMISKANKDKTFYGKKRQYSRFVGKWEEVITAYRGTMLVKQGISIAAKNYAKAKVNFGPTNFALTNLLGGSSLPITATVRGGVLTLSKAHNAIKTKVAVDSISPAEPETEPNTPFPYASLNDKDAHYDSVLDSLFKATFSLVPAEHDKKQDDVQLFETDGCGNVQKARLERVNNDIEDYYKRTERNPLRYRLHNRQVLFSLYAKLSDFIDTVEAELKEEEKQILTVLNPKGVKGDEPPINFRAVLRLFLKGDFTALGGELNFDAEALQKLDHVIAAHIACRSRILQFKRIAAHVEQLIPIDPNKKPEQYQAKVEKIADELRAKRAYSFGKSNDPEKQVNSPRLLRRFLLFEFLQDKMIWPKQFERIKNLLLSSSTDICLELLMSMGKTVFGVPTIDSYEADGKTVVINIWPAAMAKTNTRQISQQSQQTFDQTANALHINRYMPLTPEVLESIWVLIQSTAERGDTINMTREDAQALELLFIDLLYQYSEDDDPRSEEMLPMVQKILAKIRFNGGSRVVGDEAHELFNRRQELNYPVGPYKTINEGNYRVIEKGMKRLAKDKEVLQAIAENRSNELSKEKQQEALEAVAKGISKDPEVIKYLCGKASQVPDTVKTSNNWNDIALMKGLLSTLLPKALEEDIMVEHGPSDKEGEGVFSRPYGGNMSPQEESLYRVAYISLVRTFIRFFHSGLTEDEAVSVITHLKKHAEKEADKLMIDKQQTPSWNEFVHLCQNVPEDIFNEGDDRVIAAYLVENIDAICNYIHHFVKDDIFYWKYNISSNTQNFASMFPKQFYDTGTPYNEGTYPGNIKMLWDPGTIGEALHTLKKKCPKDGIHVLKKSNPEEILDEVLETYFPIGSDFTALIDGSALLKGMSNDDVVKKMMKFIKTHRPDIRGVAYFKKDSKGKDLLVVWEKDAKEPIPIDQSSIKPEERLSYYDQRHGFAADIPQKKNAKGLDLIGPKLTLFRLLQEVYRLRGLKAWKKLVGIGSKDFKKTDGQTQTVEFAMTAETKKMISSSPAPTLREIIKFAINNEAKQAALDNYHSYKQKVMDVPRRFVLDLLLKAQSVLEMSLLFWMYRSILIQEVEDDPVKLFGFVDTDVPIKQALKAIREAALKPFGGPYRQHLEKKIDAIERKPMPKTVKLQTDGKGNTKGAAADLDATVTVQAKQKQQNQAQEENENESEQQNEQENENTVMVGSEKIGHYVEMDWGFKVTPWNSVNWLKMQNPKSWYVSTSETPPLFSVNDLCKASRNTDIKEIAGSFDSRLWFTNNVLPAYKGSVSRGANIGGPEQRPIHHLLVFATNTDHGLEIESVGAISHEDRHVWEDILRNEPRPKKANKNRVAFVYDYELNSIRHTTVSKIGDADPIPDSIDNAALNESEEFRRILLQLKFLNGSCEYNDEEQKLLTRWIEETGSSKMRKAFKQIFKYQGDRPTYRGTAIDFIFKDLMELVA